MGENAMQEEILNLQDEVKMLRAVLAGKKLTREYRAVWHGSGSQLPPMQLGRVQDSEVMARMEAGRNGAAGLRAEGCSIWIESREVGSWAGPIPEPTSGSQPAQCRSDAR